MGWFIQTFRVAIKLRVVAASAAIIYSSRPGAGAAREASIFASTDTGNNTLREARNTWSNERAYVCHVPWAKGGGGGGNLFSVCSCGGKREREREHA